VYLAFFNLFGHFSIIFVVHILYYFATAHAKGCDARGGQLDVGAYGTSHDAAA
jgi:hypothetical protein